MKKVKVSVKYGPETEYEGVESVLEELGHHLSERIVSSRMTIPLRVVDNGDLTSAT